MKGRIVYLLITVIIFNGFSSCGRKIVPGTNIATSGKDYEAASFNYYYVEAVKLKLMDNAGEALKYFEQCLRINPSSDAVYYQMAQILTNGGDLINGKNYLAKAIEIDHKNIWYLIMLSRIYYQEKNIDSAIIYYEKAVKFYPGKENLLLTLGNLYSENKDFDKANLIFNRFDNEYGVNESSTLLSVKSLMASKNYDEALRKTELLLKEYPSQILYFGLLAEIYREKGENIKALEVYKKMMMVSPEDPQTQLSVCDFLISQKQYDELLVLLNTVIINEKVAKENKIGLIAQLIEIPELNSSKGNSLVMSVMILESTYKNDNIISILRPELYIKQGKLTDAVIRLNEIIKTNSDNYYAWEKLLLVYLQVGDYDNLLIKGEECASLFNRSFVAKILYANGAIEKKKYAIAIEELRKAEILAGDNKEYLNQVITMRADVYYRMKDYTKAFELFDNAIKINGNDLNVLNNYAYYLAEQNIKLKEAEIMARKVIETEKANATYLDTYAWVLYKRGKLSEASKVMEMVINSGEKMDAAHYEHYGFILRKQKKCDRAIENWNIALKLDSTKTNLLEEIINCRK